MYAELTDVTKRYGGETVLEKVSRRLEGTTVLMGPSDRGKTTLARLLLGLEKPDEGRVTVTGRLAAVFQEDRLCPQLSAVANVALALPGHDEQTARQALEELGLSGEDLTKPAALLSGGQQRRAALARAMLAPAEGVVLDEPFKGLDEDTAALAMAWTKRKADGRWLLLITHDPEQAAWFGGSLWRLGAP